MKGLYKSPALSGLLFLCLAGYAISQYEHRQNSTHGILFLAGLLCMLMVGLSQLRAAFGGAPPSNALASLMIGLMSLVLAVALTVSGLGYTHHLLKLAVISFLYFCAAFFLFWAYKRYPLGLSNKTN